MAFSKYVFVGNFRSYNTAYLENMGLKKAGSNRSANLGSNTVVSPNYISSYLIEFLIVFDALILCAFQCL